MTLSLSLGMKALLAPLSTPSLKVAVPAFTRLGPPHADTSSSEEGRATTKGFQQYGLSINWSKACANFGHHRIANVVSREERGRGWGGDAHFSWCGLSIDPRTLDVYGDYSSFFGLCINETMNIDRVSPCAIEALKHSIKL